MGWLADAVLSACFVNLATATTRTDTVRGANRTISTTVSFGAATFDFEHARESMTLDSLIATAYDTLYLAKSGGRNQVKALQLP